MNKITVADYIVQQIEKLGVKDIFGLPGDFNFNLVEAVERNENTNWIGCTNELNAGYAADGYARINGYGALITTYGVGELSAINAVAGSYAEFVPVIKITGVPATRHIKRNSLLHHNFATPDYRACERAYSNVTAATAFLDENNAKEEIDRVLNIFVNQKQPVYIAVPVDICNMEIENTPNIEIAKSNEENLKSAVEHALRLLDKASKPVIIADVLTERFQAVEETKKFIENSGYPVTTLLMGKGLIDWDYPQFIGTYIGAFDNVNTYEYVNSSDCVISIGAIMSDLNTFGFDMKFKPSDYIEIFGTYTIIENKRYDDVLMKDILNELAEKAPKKNSELPERIFSFKTPETEDKKLTAEYIYPRLQDFLQPDDIIITETGIIKCGFAPIKIPKGANLYNQVLWGSIGWATPAAFGACMAAKDKRVVLVTGEGSHQLTAQEISSMMRHGLKPIVIVINNEGYTIERVLWNKPEDKFNDIAQWDYAKLPSVFKGECWSAQAKTEKEFDEVLKEAEKIQKEKMCYIEIFTDKMDLPILTQRIIMNKLAKKTADASNQVK